MSARRTTGLVVLVAALTLGCGAPAAPPVATTTTVTPTASPSPTAASAGARLLAALQTSVADLGAVEVSGGAPHGLGRGSVTAASDLRTGEFRARVVLGDGKGELRMIRQSDLTWTSAPPSFWTGLGYTADSARRARGKWVVARAESIKPLVESLDPGIAVRALLELEPADVVSSGTVTSGDLRGRRVLRFQRGGGEQAVYVTAGARPRLVRISSTSGSVTTDLDFISFPKYVRVRLPEASDVLPPS